MKAKRVQCDEIWSFCYSNARNVGMANAAPYGTGDIWTWTAFDADSKMIVSWSVGGRAAYYAYLLMEDLRSRVKNGMQLPTDGLKAYLSAVEDILGGDVDYAQLVKPYGEAPGAGPERRYSPAECIGTRKRRITGSPDPTQVSTSYSERQNLTMRMSMGRFTRLTNAFSKKVDNPLYALSLYSVWYNFCRIHKTLRVTPATAAGLSPLRDLEWIADRRTRPASRKARPLYQGSARNFKLTATRGPTWPDEII